MPVETATYISQLNATYPAGSEDRSTADDHLRLVKSVLQNSFPNVSGAVSATHTELSMLQGSIGGTTLMAHCVLGLSADFGLTAGVSAYIPWTSEISDSQGVHAPNSEYIVVPANALFAIVKAQLKFNLVATGNDIIFADVFVNGNFPSVRVHDYSQIPQNRAEVLALFSPRFPVTAGQNIGVQVASSTYNRDVDADSWIEVMFFK